MNEYALPLCWGSQAGSAGRPVPIQPREFVKMLAVYSGDADVEDRLKDKGRGDEREGEVDGESSMGAFTLLLLLLSRFSRVRPCATPETAAHQAPPCLGFSRQEHWSGLPFPSPMHESEK